MIALLDALLAQTPAADVSGPAQINLLQAIVLGIVQGLTEFLPISSTAHLKVVPIALGWGDPGVAYTAVIQLGSIVAVLWYFWKDLTTITLGAVDAVMRRDYKSQEFQIALGIVLGTIPILFFGLLIKALVPDFDNSPLRNLTSIAIASIVMSLLLAIAEKTGKRNRTYEKLTVSDGIFMGLAQAIALIPGCSRSGSTLTAGLFHGIGKSRRRAVFFFIRNSGNYSGWISRIKGCFGRRNQRCWSCSFDSGDDFGICVFLFVDRVADQVPANSKHLGVCVVSASFWRSHFNGDRRWGIAKYLK